MMRSLNMQVLLAVSVCAISGQTCIAASADPSLMTLPRTSPSQNLRGLGLSAVFDASLVNSPRAATIRAQLGITKAAYAQALTLPNPSFFFLVDTAQRARQFGGSVPIEPPWKLAFRLLLTKAQIKQTDFEIQKNLWQLRTTVRRAYLDVVMATETQDALDDLQRLAAEILSVAQKRFSADDVAALDVNRAELASLQAEADVKQSGRKTAQAKQRLSVLMGRDYRDTIDVPRLPPFQLKAETHELLPNFREEIPNLDSLVTDALKTRLDIKIIRQSIAVNDANLRVALGNVIPNQQFNVGSSYSGNPPEGPATRGYFIGLTQEIPVLNFQQADRARLRAVKIQLNRELESTKNIVTEEVISAYQQLAAARERVGIFQEKILPASENVARMARRAYEVGQSDITSTLAAQQANVQTKASYLEAVRNYQQALTDLEQAIGHPL